MKTAYLSVLVVVLLVYTSESNPSHGKRSKKLKKKMQGAEFSNLTLHDQKVGSKRFIGGVMAAFTLFNNLADFMGRVNNVVGWFDNIDQFMETGGTESESQVNVEQVNALKSQLNTLASDVETGFKSVLAECSYTTVLTVVARDVVTLQLVDSYQKEYLNEVESYKQKPSGDRDSARMGANEDSWFEAIDDRDDTLEDALASLRSQVCGSELLGGTSSLFESYAWKHGQQNTGSVESLMNFISRVRLLETNGYAIRKNYIKKKYEDNEERKNTELRRISSRVEELTTCEDPAIATAMSTMVDHQGIPIFGRIRWSHSHQNSSSKETYDRCLTYETSAGEAEPEARACEANEQKQQWKLRSDNTLRPRNDENKCLFLIEPREAVDASSFSNQGYKVLPCSSSYRNKKFTFEYLNHRIEDERQLHTFFKLKAKNDNFVHEGWQGEDICLGFRAEPSGSTGTSFTRWGPEPFRCTCPSTTNDLHWCVEENPPPSHSNQYSWFKFEPVE